MTAGFEGVVVARVSMLVFLRRSLLQKGSEPNPIFDTRVGRIMNYTALKTLKIATTTPCPRPYSSYPKPYTRQTPKMQVQTDMPAVRLDLAEVVQE